MNYKGINREPSYVFKTSSKALELAIKIGEKASLRGKSVLWFLNMHILMLCIGCVKVYKTITMWTYHPGMKRLLHLAMMEAEKEHTEMLVLFLELFNEALTKFKGI